MGCPFKYIYIYIYYNEFYEWKRIIYELEGSLTGAPIDATNPEVPEVAVEANADEYITAEAKVS